jgi:hypothetical protein
MNEGKNENEKKMRAGRGPSERRPGTFTLPFIQHNRKE